MVVVDLDGEVVVGFEVLVGGGVLVVISGGLVIDGS